jgi:ankyrin repeat protein
MTAETWWAAVDAGDVAALERLADAGQDIDARDSHGQTAIMNAAHSGHRDAVTWLIARNANLDTTAKYGLSALMLAVVAGHIDEATTLVEAGADVAITGGGAPGFAGKTAADLAESRGYADLAALIRLRSA